MVRGWFVLVGVVLGGYALSSARNPSTVVVTIVLLSLTTGTVSGG